MSRRALFPLTTILLTTLAAGCQDGSGPADAFVVTGAIRNNTQTAIPPDVRILAVWAVSATSPDYGFVFGEGTIDRLTRRFRVRFDQPPPSEALNRDALGVGFIIATTDQNLKDGDMITGTGLLTGLLGITGQHAVIFVQNRDTVQMVPWVSKFDDGYSVGVGVKIPGAVFDGFEPTDWWKPVLIIDDLANIEVVNWT